MNSCKLKREYHSFTHWANLSTQMYYQKFKVILKIRNIRLFSHSVNCSLGALTTVCSPLSLLAHKILLICCCQFQFHVLQEFFPHYYPTLQSLCRLKWGRIFTEIVHLVLGLLEWIYYNQVEQISVLWLCRVLAFAMDAWITLLSCKFNETLYLFSSAS